MANVVSALGGTAAEKAGQLIMLKVNALRKHSWHEGDFARIVKTGSKHGQLCIITNPDWQGRVQVKMEVDDSIKSYLAEELAPPDAYEEEFIKRKKSWHEGDFARIVKAGSKHGQLCKITNPDWQGRVQVEMEVDGSIKSYLAEELAPPDEYEEQHIKRKKSWHEGDFARIVKAGSKHGQLCQITNPDWQGRVQVKMEVDGSIKSYLAEELGSPDAFEAARGGSQEDRRNHEKKAKIKALGDLLVGRVKFPPPRPCLFPKGAGMPLKRLPTADTASDHTESLQKLLKKVEMNDAQAKKEWSETCYNCANFRTAVERCQKSGGRAIMAADMEDTDAQRIVAAQFYFGEGQPQDFQKAVEYARKAALRGHPEAQRQLAAAYWWAEGVDQSYSEAQKWMTKAAKQNDVEAQKQLALMYGMGAGGPRRQGLNCGTAASNWKESARWWREAAKREDRIAQRVVGTMYLDGLGVAKDEGKAMEFLGMAAEQGDTEAQRRLGSMQMAESRGLDSSTQIRARRNSSFKIGWKCEYSKWN